MIYLKDGVRLHGLTPQAVLGIQIVASCFDKHQHNLVVTSVSEGKHMPKSLHYHGRAFDVRRPGGDEHNLAEDCDKALGGDWDFLIQKDHWHFEWDPRGKP